MTDSHTLDKALALLKSMAADHNSDPVEDHAWRTCRACLASEELGYTKVGELSSPAQRLLRAIPAAFDALRAENERLKAESAYHERQQERDAELILELERKADAWDRLKEWASGRATVILRNEGSLAVPTGDYDCDMEWSAAVAELRCVLAKMAELEAHDA